MTIMDQSVPLHSTPETGDWLRGHLEIYQRQNGQSTYTHLLEVVSRAANSIKAERPKFTSHIPLTVKKLPDNNFIKPLQATPSHSKHPTPSTTPSSS